MSELQSAIATVKQKLANADKRNAGFQGFSIAEMEAIWGVLAKAESEQADLQQKLDAMAAENAALKAVVEPIANLAQYSDIVSEMSKALRPHEIDTFVSIFAKAKAISATTVTDSYLNSVRAHAITAALSDCTDNCDTDFVMDAYDFNYEIAESRAAGATDLRDELASYAAHLRASAGKDGWDE